MIRRHRITGVHRFSCLHCDIAARTTKNRAVATRWAREHAEKNPEHTALVDVEYSTYYRSTAPAKE